MLIVVMERSWCVPFASWRVVRTNRISRFARGWKLLDADKLRVECVYNSGPRITGRRNGEVAKGIFGDGVGGIDCGADCGGCVAGRSRRGGGARSDEGGASWGAVGVRCGACGWARGFD